MVAYPIWIGAVTFTVYNYVIYTFAIHFGPLFLLWVAVLGLAMYALIGGLLAIDLGLDDGASRRSRPTPGRGLVPDHVGVAFALLWLMDIARALRDDEIPAAAADLGLPTNPVHVLDLALFLPAAIVVGVFLLRSAPAGFVLGPALLLFLALTGLPIMVTPFVAWARGDDTTWALLIPIGAITVASTGFASGWSGAQASDTAVTEHKLCREADTFTAQMVWLLRRRIPDRRPHKVVTVEVGGVVVLIPKLVDDLDDTVHALAQPDRDLSRAAPVGGSA